MSKPELPSAPDGSIDAAELDPRLRATFRLAEVSPSADPVFVQRVVLRVQRRRRGRLALRAALGAALVAALGVAVGMSQALPGLRETIRALPLAAAHSITPLGAWLVTPGGWMVSLLLGGAVLWRSGALRR